MDERDAFDEFEDATPSEASKPQESSNAMPEDTVDAFYTPAVTIESVEPPADAEPTIEASANEDGATADSPSADSPSVAHPAKDATAVAYNTIQQLKDGVEAISSVYAAAKKHSSARAQLEELKRELEEAMAILDHRVEIERNYTQIVAEQTTQIDACKANLAATQARIEQLSAERAELSGKLRTLKAENEEALRPYKNLMDTSKGRADDAAESLSSIRRAVRTAESEANEATRKRDTSISAANRAVDNAQDRLRKVQTELDKLQGDPDAPANALPMMRDELKSEKDHLAAAREEVDRITAEAQANVEETQNRLFELRQTQEAAERTADEAKREAKTSRDEYDHKYKECKAAEDALESEIKQRTDDIASAEKDCENIQKNIEELQIVLDEANDIHDTPEVTRQLRDRITTGQAELQRQDREVRDLAQTEKELRQSTRKNRIAVFALILGVIALIAILLIWFISTR